MSTRKKKAAKPAEAPPEPKASPKRSGRPRAKVETQPYSLRGGVKILVTGDPEKFTVKYESGYIFITTNDSPMPAVSFPGIGITGSRTAPQQQFAQPSGSVENSGIEYTDLGPSAAEAAMYRAPAGVVPDINLPLDQILKLNNQAAAIASEKMGAVGREDSN